MKKLYSLIKACMTSDMNIFKIKSKKGGKSSNKVLVIFIAICLMFTMWANANMLFEQMAPMHLEYIVLSLAVFAVSLFTIIEGIYKTGSLIFNCKDDQLLLSLPIRRSTVLFIRIFKFYVFELMFSAIFMIPIVVAYMRWADNINFLFFVTNFIMLFVIPIIPIAISCIIGAIISALSSRFKRKNIVQIVISMLFVMVALYASFNMEGFYEYVAKNATSVNDLIIKIYYPAGMYTKLITDFNIIDLLVFILIHLAIFGITIFILSKFYFKINSRLKKVSSNKKVSVDKLKIKSSSSTKSLIKKEINTFFTTPVFIINAGFSLVLFIIGAILISVKFDSFLVGLTDPNGLNISENLIRSNVSLVILALISIAAYMTSITSSLVSLEGKSLSILKSLPVSTKTILLSKVYSGLVITTPAILIGDIILFIKFKTGIIDLILLLILSVLIPLVSHLVGLIINLKFPKLDFENATEVVKQSTSSFVSVMIGMVLFIVSNAIILKIAGTLNSTVILILSIIIHLIIDSVLYLYLLKKGVKEFDRLSI